jgi:hypothetical protein
MFDMFFDDNFGGGGGAPGKRDITHIYLAAASGDETPTDEEVHRFFLTLQNNSLSIQPKDSRTADGQMIYTVNGSQAFVSDVFRQAGGYVDNFDASGCTGIDSRRFSQLEGAITVRLPEQHA